MTKAKVLYRYKDKGGEIYLEEFRVYKNTPKGYWIKTYPLLPKLTFVLDIGRKRYAYPTLELAKESFLARKTRQIIILTAYLDNVKAARTQMIRGVIGKKDYVLFE